ncbi:MULTISPECIES: SpoIIE family protein phosphatase [unclassified Streptomyces]|uniref:PP2C family protein-serine/threonine phosphatase n=1 Tax=unclassified Streptomyces TaxID=2593676 RepID=UPI002DD91343|nr:MULTISPECIES: SpoIIE family protein phosphatase [unclassified Streptomyces]WSA91903.1 SpoIIE family protein phosphatase [Streptomyces sp. NBC_01795]WSB76271.1 SpoIIE family protein phosphatase [Streptomyces sp. NBC_01775]WSS15453.1 SpoIIE family protein phosphatase [Streptomyces sp. NBC_01186]WSS44296.1 SpoIIE family protein phosphatase [Streptomyces sp. NBC_01187]
MCGAGDGRDREPGTESGAAESGADNERARFSSLLEESAEDLYENAPCGYLSTLLDGRIAKVNHTLLSWLGYRREDLLGRRRFADLLTVGGKLYHETHFAPLLRMQGEISSIALELEAADGSRLPVLVTATLQKSDEGEPLLIRTTVLDARDRRAYETELLRARQEADRERERLQRLATTLQKTLMPPVLENVPGLDVSAYYHVASVDEVGGDFYDLFPLAAGTWGLFLGDVRGKGAGAAAITSLVRYTLRATAVYEPDPAAVLGHLNTVLNREADSVDPHSADPDGADPRFCTVLFGRLTPDDRGGFRVALASGGHPPAVLMRADGSADFLPTPGGQMVGALPAADIATTTVQLAPGDTLLLYTDGLTEARTALEGERYGDEALLELSHSLSPTTARSLVTTLKNLLESLGAGVEDDTALLAITVPQPDGGGQHP